MDKVAQATLTQLSNIEKRTGISLAELIQQLRASGAIKHAERVAFLKDKFSMGHGDANALVHHAASLAAPAGSAPTDPLADIYTGGKAGLRPLHEAILQALSSFGDFEVAPKKAYVSLRRSRQFAMVGPATAKAIQIGINHKSLGEAPRLKAEKPGGMCQYTVRISDLTEIDAELLGWLKSAFDAAG